MTAETEQPTASLGAARIVYEVPVCNGRPAGIMSIDCTAINLYAERPPLVRAQIEGGGAVIIPWHRVVRIESQAAAALRTGDEATHTIKPRTAEDERRDVLAFLCGEVGALAAGEGEFDDAETKVRRAARIAELNYMARNIARGDHEGAADR